MPSADLLLSFALASILIELTPGPNMAYLAVLSVGHGQRAGLSAVVGIALGLLGAGLVAALGLAAVLDSFPPAYQALRWAGVLYLLWLAWEAWRGGETSAAATTPGVEPNTLHFRRGLVTNLLNPKAFLFYVAVLPRFVEPTRDIPSQTIILSVVYVAIATVIHTAVALLAARAQPRLARFEHTVVIRRIFALALAVVAGWFAYSTSR